MVPKRESHVEHKGHVRKENSRGLVGLIKNSQTYILLFCMVFLSELEVLGKERKKEIRATTTLYIAL